MITSSNSSVKRSGTLNHYVGDLLRGGRTRGGDKYFQKWGEMPAGYELTEDDFENSSASKVF